jgi:hypothetical protein
MDFPELGIENLIVLLLRREGKDLYELFYDELDHQDYF